MPLPGTNRRRATRRVSAEEQQTANRDLANLAAWAQMQGGGR